MLNKDRIELGIKKLGRELGINASLFEYKEGDRPVNKSLHVFSFMGKDKQGIFAEISKILANREANIETIQMKVRRGWIYNQIILDLSAVDSKEEFRNELRLKCQEFNLSMMLQEEKLYRTNKKLVVFDMDSTLIIGETIVEMAKIVNKSEEMNIATDKAMSSDLNFKTSLIDRTKLLRGLKIDDLDKIADGLKFTPGAELLISHIKKMGYKIAIVSSGFSIFTDSVKDKLGLDYSFGNTLEISDGVVTGEVIGEIIDAEGKWDLITDLCEQLNINKEELVTIGDGSNDRVMLSNSGLGIGLNSKEITSKVADGRVTSEDVSMLLLMFGLSDTEINAILD
ncbi:MAG: phosphoserine phosphatase SerB [Candidatus Heimdallarchaeota archaeon]|nr:phosphoserine phosphatase SerB [Candidatus Heimdallarchaeota archaeon]